MLMMKNISAFTTETRSGTLKPNGVNQRIKVSTLIGKTSGMASFDKKIYESMIRSKHTSYNKFRLVTW